MPNSIIYVFLLKEKNKPFSIQVVQLLTLS